MDPQNITTPSVPIKQTPTEEWLDYLGKTLQDEFNSLGETQRLNSLAADVLGHSPTDSFSTYYFEWVEMVQLYEHVVVRTISIETMDVMRFTMKDNMAYFELTKKKNLSEFLACLKEGIALSENIYQQMNPILKLAPPVQQKALSFGSIGSFGKQNAQNLCLPSCLDDSKSIPGAKKNLNFMGKPSPPNPFMQHRPPSPCANQIPVNSSKFKNSSLQSPAMNRPRSMAASNRIQDHSPVYPSPPKWKPNHRNTLVQKIPDSQPCSDWDLGMDELDQNNQQQIDEVADMFNEELKVDFANLPEPSMRKSPADIKAMPYPSLYGDASIYDYRFCWYYDHSKHYKECGQFEEIAKMKRLKQMAFDDPDLMIKFVLGKLTNRKITGLAIQSKVYQDMARELNLFHWGDESRNFFSYPENEVVSVPSQGECLLNQVKANLQPKAETMYRSFLKQVESGGPETKEFEIPDLSLLVFMDKEGLDRGNIFKIIDDSDEGSFMIRRIQEPYMPVSFQRKEWRKAADDPFINPFSAEDQETFSSFLQEAREKKSAEKESTTFFVKAVRLSDTNQYMLHADLLSDLKTLNLIKHTPDFFVRPSTSWKISIQTLAKTQHDILGCFLEMKEHAASFGYAIRTLAPEEFEFKLVETAFRMTVSNLVAEPHPSTTKLLKVQKIYNQSILDKFSLELRSNLKKYPNKTAWDLVRLMFHGTRNTNPEEIYTSEYGLDHRYSHQGYYGNGIYFSDNAHYCRNYVHRGDVMVNQNFKKVNQLFLCHVVAGESVKLSRQQLKVPPLKRDYQNNRQQEFIRSDSMLNRDVYNSAIRFDSVENEDRTHLIIYDYNKQYPAYLLSYE